MTWDQATHSVPTMPNLADVLTRSAAAHPDDPAIKLDDRELSYAELDAAAAQVAGLLRAKGVGPGDRVGIMLPNVPYFAACYYGALRAGAAVVPMNVLLKEREVAFYLGDSGAKVLFAWHQFADAAHAGAEQAGSECVLVEPGELEDLLAHCEPVRAVAERRPDDTAVILYTSGTTGTPKGAELTHAQPALQRRGQRRAVRARRALRHARRVAAVPRVRADLCTQRDDRRRRLPDAAAAVRRR
jgi:long-chain acyl-CoA synthetase